MKFLYDFTIAVLSNMFTNTITKPNPEYVYVDTDNNSNDVILAIFLLITLALLFLSLNMILGIIVLVILSTIACLILFSAWKELIRSKSPFSPSSDCALLAFFCEVGSNFGMLVLSIIFEYIYPVKIYGISLGALMLCVGIMSSISTTKICLTDYVKYRVLLKNPEYILLIKVVVVIVVIIFSISFSTDIQ